MDAIPTIKPEQRQLDITPETAALLTSLSIEADAAQSRLQLALRTALAEHRMRGDWRVVTMTDGEHPTLTLEPV